MQLGQAEAANARRHGGQRFAVAIIVGVVSLVLNLWVFAAASLRSPFWLLLLLVEGAATVIAGITTRGGTSRLHGLAFAASAGLGLGVAPYFLWLLVGTLAYLIR
ncbi:hypothetical protein SAMN05444157_0620 [Frankineae bacterium MT45]|nr:hypothetical protein SAMN05444157_0620 [Frankineae bacterium MT45]